MSASDPPGVRLPLGAALALVALALVLRLACVTVVPRAILYPDAREFAEIARSLVAGHGFGTQTQRPPGYPAFMAAVWSVTGGSLTALRVAESLIGTLSVALIGWFGVRWFGRRAGLIAMAAAACHPVLAFLPSTQYSENLIVLVCVLAYGCLLGAVAEPRSGLGRWLAGGVLLGVATLIRPNTVTLLPGLALGAAWPLSRAGRPVVLPLVVCIAAAALTVTPWIARQHRVAGHWFFIATGGGKSLWLGNNDRTTGRAGSIAWPDSALDVQLAGLPDDVSKDRRMGELAFAWMRADPARAVRMYLIRLNSLWAFYPETYTRNRFTSDLARLAQAVMSAFVFAGALLALARARGEPLVPPMVGAIVGFSLINAMFFMVLRYRMPFEPLLIWLAGLGWATVRAPVARRA